MKKKEEQLNLLKIRHKDILRTFYGDEQARLLKILQNYKRHLNELYQWYTKIMHNLKHLKRLMTISKLQFGLVNAQYHQSVTEINNIVRYLLGNSTELDNLQKSIECIFLVVDFDDFKRSKFLARFITLQNAHEELCLSTEQLKEDVYQLAKDYSAIEIKLLDLEAYYTGKFADETFWRKLLKRFTDRTRENSLEAKRLFLSKIIQSANNPDFIQMCAQRRLSYTDIVKELASPLEQQTTMVPDDSTPTTPKFLRF